jgi:hypothetical protein
MPVESKHPDWSKHRKLWDRIRDVKEGEDKMRETRTKYLPQLAGQEDSSYQQYFDRANLFNATARTIDGLSGLVFRKEPMVEAPAGLDPFRENIDLMGMDLTGFAELVMDENLTVGRGGILVDRGQAPNSRPYLRFYRAESIIDWRTSVIAGEEIVQQVRVWENVQLPSPEDEFESVMVDRIRVLELAFPPEIAIEDITPNTIPIYQQRIFTRAKENDPFIQDGPPITPTIQGTRFERIPFVFVGPNNNKPKIEKPPLIDLVNINVHHFQNSADLEEGLHWAALPTPVVTGVMLDEGQKLDIGSRTAWVFDNPEAKAFFLELDGQSLPVLKESMEDKKTEMSLLGARIIAPEKRAAEAAETEAIRRGGENSSLASMAISVSKAIEKSLDVLATWAGIAGEITFQLNRDYMPVPMPPQQLAQLIAAWQSNALGLEDLFLNLQRGEIIDSAKSFDVYQQELEDQSAPPGMFGPDGEEIEESEEDVIEDEL